MPITQGIYTPTGYLNHLQIIYMYATIGSQAPGAEHMLALVVVDICGTECMLVLVAVDNYFCLMLTLRSANPSLDQDLSVIIDDVNQLPSWEALHTFLSVLPN